MSSSLQRFVNQVEERAQRITFDRHERVVTERPAPLDVAASCGLDDPDDWQAKILTSEARKQILNCTRQAGKSTVTSVVAIDEAIHVACALVLLASPSQKQSSELFRKVMQAYYTCDLEKPTVVQESLLSVEFSNGARVVALPGSEATVRGYSAATLVVIDEASRVPDELVTAVRPTLATTNGRLIVLSTPWGKRGFFWEQWSSGEGWERTEVKASHIKRIAPEYLEDQRRELGEFRYRQEYECEFMDSETSVFSSELIASVFADDSTPMWED